jgi:hypothetical protein
MRAWPIELTKYEFDRFFYNYVTNVCSEDAAEHLVSLRLLEKIQDPKLVERHDPPQSEIDRVEATDGFWWPTYKLAHPTHTFLLEEDEKRLALKRLEANIAHLPPRAGIEFEVVRQKLVNAEQIDVTPALDVGGNREIDLVEG